MCHSCSRLVSLEQAKQHTCKCRDGLSPAPCVYMGEHRVPRRKHSARWYNAGMCQLLVSEISHQLPVLRVENAHRLSEASSWNKCASESPLPCSSKKAKRALQHMGRRQWWSSFYRLLEHNKETTCLLRTFRSPQLLWVLLHLSVLGMTHILDADIEQRVPESRPATAAICTVPAGSEIMPQAVFFFTSLSSLGSQVPGGSLEHLGEARETTSIYCSKQSSDKCWFCTTGWAFLFSQPSSTEGHLLPHYRDTVSGTPLPTVL